MPLIIRGLHPFTFAPLNGTIEWIRRFKAWPIADKARA